MSFLFRRQRSVQSRLISFAIGIAIVFLIRFVNPRPHVIETDTPSGPPSHSYDVPPSMAATFAAQFAVKKLGWKIDSSAPMSGTVQLSTSRLFGLQHDNLTIRCVPITDRYTRVTMESAGNFDSSGHIMALQSGMDDKLPAAPSP